MFKTHNKVRMHDTDMAGILYFANQFRFAHDALEDFMESEGFTFERIFHQEEFVFVIVHAEADYLAALSVGDHLEVHLNVEKMGQSSFTLGYEIFRKKVLVGKVKTVHVCLKSQERVKVPIPPIFMNILKKHTVPKHIEKLEV